MNSTIKKTKSTIDDKNVSLKPRSFVKTLLEQNYSKLSKAKEKFVDDLFPPSQASILSDTSKEKEVVKVQEIPSFIKKQLPQNNTIINIADQAQNYVWKRLSELYKSNEINIVKEPPEIKDFPDIMTEDVVQGDLGDCYFLSVLSALAETPGRIKSLFPIQNFSPNGLFECKVYIHGQPVSIVIDDFFPCKLLSDGVFQLAFTGINKMTKNIWPMLLEKVWAKVNHNYKNIISGVPSEAFEFLFPAPFDTFYHEHSHETLFEYIKSADQKTYIICCSITQSDTSANLDYLANMGLISNHAYTIIAAYEISEFSGKRVRLLKLRNPWGSNEWSGDWSDNSSKWNPELKKILNFKSQDDGTFYMCYEDYLRFYTTTYISKYHDNYFFVSSKFEYQPLNMHNLVTIKVTSEGHGFFILNQKNKRIYRNLKNQPDFENKFCSMTVFKKDNSYTYIGAMSGNGNRLYVESFLSPGIYVVAVYFPTPSEPDQENLEFDKYKQSYTEKMIKSDLSYRIGIYSNIDKLQIVPVPEKEYEAYDDSLMKVMINRAQSSHNKHFFIEEGEKDSWRSLAFDDDNGLICYNNQSDGYILERITFTTLFGLNIIPLFCSSRENIENSDEYIEEVEDPFERNAITKLRSNMENSSLKVLKPKVKDMEVSVENPYVVEINIAPKSQGLIVLEKYDNNSGMEIDSNLIIIYPLSILLGEKKFRVKKSRVKYHEEFAEIYESIIEHNCGVLFKYRNKTRDLKFNVHIKFNKMSNLILNSQTDFNYNLTSEISVTSISKKTTEKIINTEEYKSVDPTELKIDIEDKNKEILISLEPGETRFFELCSEEIFKVFSYECETNYYINLSRQYAKKNYGF